MNLSSNMRLLLWAAGAVGLLGLILNLVDWWQGTLHFAAPKLVDQIGMLLLLGALLLARLPPAARAWLTGLALVLIVPSTTLIVWHAL